MENVKKSFVLETKTATEPTYLYDNLNTSLYGDQLIFNLSVKKVRKTSHISAISWRELYP